MGNSNFSPTKETLEKRDIMKEVIAAINKRHEQYRMAFEKIMAILQRSNLAAAEEVKAVYEIIA